MLMDYMIFIIKKEIKVLTFCCAINRKKREKKENGGLKKKWPVYMRNMAVMGRKYDFIDRFKLKLY